jgi:flagellin
MANVDVTRIAGNIAALNSLNALQDVNNQLAAHQARLATGKRLMQSSDDPAGMSIATSFDIRRQAIQTTLSSIGDAKNLLSNTETGLNKIKDLLVKMENSALQSKGDTLGTQERAAVFGQLQAYRDEINDIVKQTVWNGKNLISGSGGSGSTATMNFLTDPDATAQGTSTFSFQSTTTSKISNGQGFQASTATLGATGLGLVDANIFVSSTTAGSTAATNIHSALTAVQEGIAQVGAFVARLTSKEETLTVQNANTEAAYNRIANANMAQEQVEASKLTILQQTSTAMLAQANTSPQFLLQLFK